MEQILKLIEENVPVDCACIGEIQEQGKMFSLYAGFGLAENAGIGVPIPLNGFKAAAMSVFSRSEVVFGESNAEHCKMMSLLTGGRPVKNGVCIPLASGDCTSGASLLMVCRFSDASFSQKDVAFIRAMAGIASVSVRKMNLQDSMSIQLKSIERAKKHWELAIDSLPQLIIALNEHAQVIRVNRTAETWGMGKVTEAGGSSLFDYLGQVLGDYPREKWDLQWMHNWLRMAEDSHPQWEIESSAQSRIFHFTLKNIPPVPGDQDPCCAILFIDDVTERKMAEQNLRNHACELEKKVEQRTMELKLANQQLEHELYEQKNARDILAEYQECRLRLLRELISAQETERKRIAGELHDSIGQSLGATKFKVEELLTSRIDVLDEEDTLQLADIVDKIKQVIDEVRHIAMDLRPAMLDDLGVVATLNWFCREFEGTYSALQVNRILDVDEKDISHDMKVVIFRIVQEAMNNVVKHANATCIELELYSSSSGLKLSISDNGRGFDKAFMFGKNGSICSLNGDPYVCGFGLNSMCERAESTNGCFSVESIPESGTSVQVIWN